MRRFFVEEIKQEEGLFSIKGPEARHIVRVLRMGRGDRFVLMDRNGARFLALIESVQGREVLVTLEKALPATAPSPVEITLCQALLKSGPMDYLIQKTSELGVRQIFPFISERTVVKVDGKRAAAKLQHWREIALYAATQSDRDVPAEIGPVSSLRETMERWASEEASKVTLWEEEKSEDLKTHIRMSLPARRFVGIIGPEGGFSMEEILAARKAGFRTVSLGRRILRAETAAIAMAALVQFEWGDLSLKSRE